MMNRLGFVIVLVFASVFLGQSRARAAAGEDTEEPKPEGAAGASSAPAPSSGSSSSSPAAIVAAPASADRATGALTPGAVVFGVGLRTRYVSVPGWLLGLFTKHNMPLSTFAHYGAEGYRRRGNFQITIGLSYQNMSPPDGNWLASGQHTAEMDTRFLQFRGLALYSADVAFLWQTMVSRWFGLHAGAGFGVAIVAGDVYVNVSEGCTPSNLGNTTLCHPRGVTCANGICTPGSALSHSPNSDKLPVIPVIDLLFGVDFRLPDVKGWEAKLEAGFFDAFFAGLGVGYTF